MWSWLTRHLACAMSIGRRGERVAARTLRRAGLRILARNVRFGREEIDIVALDGNTLVFVEVKSRTGKSWSDGLEKIDRRKRRALRRACQAYLSAIAGRARAYRIDAVSVEFERGRWGLRVVDVYWVECIFDLDAPGR